MRVLIPLALMLLIVGALTLSSCDTFGSSGDIAPLETRNAQLQGTIEVMGTPMQTIAALQQAATEAVVLEARVAQAEADALAARATLTVLELTSGGGAVAVRPTSASVEMPGGGEAPLGAPTPAPSEGQTRFTNTVVATGRDKNDCAVGANTTFDPTANELLVVTRIDYLPAGSQISARWSVNGSLYFDDVQCWAPDQPYTDICAYCVVTHEGAAFQAGSWSVEMLLDGQVMSQAQFQIVDAAQQAPAGGGGESGGPATS